jgi:phage gpG-like protein
MADGLTIEFKDEEVQKLLTKLLKRVNNPAKLMKELERYVHAMTMKMFRGVRPDTKGVRGIKWEPLKQKTIEQKAALRKRGKAKEIHRPLVRTGKYRDSLKVLGRSSKGFEYGTRVKSKKGFPYPGQHQAGGPNLPQRKAILLTRTDLRQMVSMAISFLKNKEIAFKKFIKR